MKKGIIILGVLLMGAGICVSTWLFLRAQTARTRLPVASNRIGTGRTSQTDIVPDDEKVLTEKERAVERTKRAFISKLSEVQRADPFMQKTLEVMDSPEFFDLLEKDLTERQWNDFMESKGVPVTREYPGFFRKVVSDIALADYEPVVRLKFAELFLAAESVDLTDPRAAARQRSKVYLELGKEFTKTDMAALAWFIETFSEDRDGAFRSEGVEHNAAFIWMTDIQQNAASIVASTKTTEVDAPETQASAPSWDMSSVMESPSVFPDEIEGNRPSMAAPSMAADEQYNTKKRTAATPMADLEKGVTDALPPLPEPPTVEELETSLKAQFSSERFERAMSTLERYGTEEGLRRLRENDPEVARQIERSRQRDEEEVSK